MEYVNEFIYLTVRQKKDIDTSFCTTEQDKNDVYLTFGLFANDCLFDLTDNNYEFEIRI